ncbi:MAG: efflux RND transporter periplasmic adaptor subunit [Acidobacteriota bacterium]
MATTEKDIVLDENLSEVFDEEVIEEQTEEEKPRSRVPIYVIGGIIAVCAILGLSWWLYSRQFATTDDAFIEGNITIVSPKISAHVAKVYVTENQFVKKGDLLIELDAQESEIKLAQAKAALQTAIANRGKAEANVSLTHLTGNADLSQAKSNLQTAKTDIEQNRFASSSKQNAIEQARRQTITAEANLKQFQAQIPAANAGIEQAKAQVSAAKSKSETARLEYERDKKLFDGGIVSRQKLEQSNKELSAAQADFVSAQKQVEIAQAQLNALNRQVEVASARLDEVKGTIASAENDYRQSLAQINVASSQADESAGRLQGAENLPAQDAVGRSDVDIAAAQIQQAQTLINQAEIELGFTKIYAPQDGYISRKSVQEGQLVQAEQALLTVTQGGIWIVANYKETQIEKIKIGQPVDIYVDAYPSATFHGKVEGFQAGTGSRFSVLPGENSTGNFVKVVQRIPVKIVFDEIPDSQKYLLVPGMSVVPKVHIK